MVPIAEPTSDDYGCRPQMLQIIDENKQFSYDLAAFLYMMFLMNFVANMCRSTWINGVWPMLASIITWSLYLGRNPLEKVLYIITHYLCLYRFDKALC